MKTRTIVLGGAFFCAAAWVGCTSSEPPLVDGCTKDTDCKGDRVCDNHVCVSSVGTGGAGGVAGAGVAGTGGVADASVGGTGGAAGFGGLPGMGGTAGIGGAGGTCASIEMKAEVLPLDLYFMVDRSMSMTGTPWTNQSNALKAFFTDQKSSGLWTALTFFPLNNASAPMDNLCSGAAYAKPLINWGELPAAQDSFVSAVEAATAKGSFTPTQEALQGVLTGAKARQLEEPMHQVAAVIVSDGEPCCDSCPVETAKGLGDIAASYASGSPPIRTFSIFVATIATDVMTAVAKGGGTELAFDATAGQAAFTAALQKIHSAALSCEYKMPTADGGIVDPDYLVVNYKSDPSATPEKLMRKADAAACANGPGWFYDNNTAPQKIIFCPQSCSTLKSNAIGSIQILATCTSSKL